jgi:hypothetical protein
MAPTAFLYGALFAIGYCAARWKYDDLSCIILGALGMAAVVAAIPAPAVLSAHAKLARYHLGEVAHPGLITPAGDIRLEGTDMQNGWSDGAYGALQCQLPCPVVHPRRPFGHHGTGEP